MQAFEPFQAVQTLQALPMVEMIEVILGGEVRNTWELEWSTVLTRPMPVTRNEPGGIQHTRNELNGYVFYPLLAFYDTRWAVRNPAGGRPGGRID